MKLNDIHIRDPFILPYQNKYYLYGTKCVPSELKAIDVYVSSDLENWSEPICVFERSDEFWGKDNFWAPEVHYYNEKFYMFATFVSDEHNLATHVLTCDTPDGKFVPVSEKPATPWEWFSLDGTLYVDKNGEPHLVFCHEWVQIGDGTVCEVKLSKDLSHPVSEPKLLWAASVYKDVKSVTAKDGDYVTDGPFMYRNSKNELLCIWSTFNENGYTELICKSDNGDIDGNWSLLEQPLSSCDGGHGMIFEAFDGKKYFIMHKPNCDPLERPVLTELFEEDGKIYI